MSTFPMERRGMGGRCANFMVAVSPLSLLKNPMILIAGLSMLVVFGMPYLMDNSKFFPFRPSTFSPSYLSSLKSCEIKN